MIVLEYGHKLVKIMPMSTLVKYQRHKRLGVFYHKGLRCVCCGVKGVHLVQARDKGGRKHVDIYTADWTLMTVDHDKPRALGGDNGIANKQPMCMYCNSIKAARVLTVRQLRWRIRRRYIILLIKVW